MTRIRDLVIVSLFALASIPCSGCDSCNQITKAEHEIAREVREGPCIEQAQLLATTGGSPSDMLCPNKLHRIDVQSATLAGEEIGAVVTCRCVRPDGGHDD